MLDLHTHSTFSDGADTPEELVAAAVAQGVTGMALTDHDTMDGVPRFLQAAQAAGVRAISGVEISADDPGGGMHILGYGMPVDHPTLQSRLRWLRAGRADRNLKILEKLNGLGMPLPWEEVAGLAGEDVVGRPHFAQALELHGWVSDKKEAFDRFLGRQGAAYVDRARLSPGECIRLIHGAGGVPVLAHPATLSLSPAALIRRIEALRAAGLAGLECHYSEHDARMTQRLLDLAQRLGLLVTGGSDYHGAGTPGIRLGKGFGPLRVPAGALDALQARNAARHESPLDVIGEQ